MRAILATLYYLIVFVGMIILGVPYIIYKGYIRGHKEEITNVCQFFFKNIAFKLFRIKIKIEGEENIPKGRKGFVIVANHQSFLDINVIWPAIGNAAFMAKASLWKAPVFGWVISTIGCIPVHKNPRMNAGMGKLVSERIAKGYNFAVFPEGHRTEDGHMLKFQNGIFRMAKDQNFDILPITLVNTGEILPKVKWSIRGGEVRMVIHPMVKASDYADKSMAELRDELHDLVESAMPYKQAELAQAKLDAESGTKEA
ncbi:1-acyl-sn-glycerol-3-phosphate acyltransferase [Fibrobacter sp.]|uniref:lysophospholipid acyltransferase family protein n=1 Tax=Fibrobacter sp. TaxID=35828 RepID=UPI0025C6C666|nr:1-acyl-sn-glycerol-3-phosphate acyltransferase [Fibrobacter sp.]MBR4006330.1 1-acyl-sn-glycerol-3-phosphate acyltransferase [Fibrobacter sp.]